MLKEIIVHEKLEDMQIRSQLLEHVLERLHDNNLEGFEPERPGLDGSMMLIERVNDHVGDENKIGLFKKYGFKLEKKGKMVKHKGVWEATKKKQEQGKK